MMFGFLFFFVLIGVGVWWFAQQQGVQGPRPQQQSDPMDIARMRYARGEITKEQFDEISANLRI